MSDILKRIKTNSLITAVIYAALGLVLLVWPGLSASIICTAIGVVLCLITVAAMALINLIFPKEKYEM